MSFNHHRPIG